MILTKKEINQKHIFNLKYKYCMRQRFYSYIISTTFHGIYIDQWRKLAPKA
jgi:hypothetical protein